MPLSDQGPTGEGCVVGYYLLRCFTAVTASVIARGKTSQDRSLEPIIIGIRLSLEPLSIFERWREREKEQETYITQSCNAIDVNELTSDLVHIRILCARNIMTICLCRV